MLLSADKVQEDANFLFTQDFELSLAVKTTSNWFADISPNSAKGNAAYCHYLYKMEAYEISKSEWNEVGGVHSVTIYF